MAKKALILLVIFFSLLVISTSSVNAQDAVDPWSSKYDKDQMDSYTNAILADNCATPSLECLVHQTFRFVAIELTNNIVPAATQNDKKQQTGSAPKQGVVADLNGLIGQMYSNPPANTSIYIADIMNSAHITPRAYAQGLGFASLNPILELWKLFRNLAYLFYVFIFIVIGFMIMFRQKIGGQTAVTAQQSIPRVIVSLIFVTFSYAIAGFLIDLMYVAIFLIIGIFGQTLPSGNENIIDANIIDLMGQLFGIVRDFDSGNVISSLLDSLIIADEVNNFLGFIGGLTLSVVIAIAVLIGTFKLFFELLKSYVTVIISVVIGPIILMKMSLPGNGNELKGWIMNIVGNLSAFVTTTFTTVIFYQFNEVNAGANTEGGFVPPFLLGRGQSGAISTLMGLAIILALPEIVKDVKKRLGASEGFGTMVAKAATDSAKKGWSGGELIPGVAASNTARLPGVGKYMGSAKNIARSASVATSTALPAAATFIPKSASYLGHNALRKVSKGRFGGVPENPIDATIEAGKKGFDWSSEKTGFNKKKE